MDEFGELFDGAASSTFSFLGCGHLANLTVCSYLRFRAIV